MILLSIVIPTFNRCESLINTLEAMRPIFNVNGVEILVVDNHSNDETWKFLSDTYKVLGVSILQNPLNLGIEGNIIQGLLNAQGKYIWLLSDHMKIEVPEVLVLLDKLRKGLDFDLGYARISQYSSVLSATYTPFSLEELSQYSIGELAFYMGNISAFIINRDFLSQCGRTIFRFAGTSYPQLGTFVHTKVSTTFVEFPPMSSFSWTGIRKRRVSYDTFRSRFIGFVNAINNIRRLNSRLNNINLALKTNILIRALAFDSMSNLCFAIKNPVKYYEYVFCFKHYKGIIRFYLLFCILLALLPTKLRLSLSKLIFSKIFPKQYEAAKFDFQSQFSSEFIKE